MSAVKNAEGTQKLSVFKMTWPIFIEILLQMMVGNVDQFMLSHYSQHSVAAVGNANQIINIVILALSVISMAATILIAQHRGAGNREKVAEVCTVALLANMVFGVMITSVVMNLINIAGNCILIHGLGPIPSLGVLGVTISTNTSKVLGLLLILYFFRKFIDIRLSFKYLRPFPKSTLYKILYLGLPSGGESLSYQISPAANRFPTRFRRWLLCALLT